MDTPLVPWQVFFDALKKQNPGTLELWLCRWLFTNEGVIEADPRFVMLYSKFHIADFKAATPSGRAA
ncbi:MAG TPA: hypothetical protein VHV54_27370 [Candidatus Binatia bacterium]|jgi:hypothetical protein|nr:hypothetical protein [Candidatus Binatia bacterium]